jgi:hypothetical protein
MGAGSIGAVPGIVARGSTGNNAQAAAHGHG